MGWGQRGKLYENGISWIRECPLGHYCFEVVTDDIEKVELLIDYPWDTYYDQYYIRGCGGEFGTPTQFHPYRKNLKVRFAAPGSRDITKMNITTPPIITGQGGTVVMDLKYECRRDMCDRGHPFPKKKACFAGSEMISLESGALKLISDVRIGDRVLAADINGRTIFSDVLVVPHKPNDDIAEFVVLATASGRDIKLTPDHLVFVTDCGSFSAPSLVRASEVRPDENMCLRTVAGPELVVSSQTLSGFGVYSIVPKDAEFIVVNGVIASPFAVNHAAVNAFYNVYRMTSTLLETISIDSAFVTSVVQAFGEMVPSF